MSFRVTVSPTRVLTRSTGPWVRSLASYYYAISIPNAHLLYRRILTGQRRRHWGRLQIAGCVLESPPFAFCLGVRRNECDSKNIHDTVQESYTGRVKWRSTTYCGGDGKSEGRGGAVGRLEQLALCCRHESLFMLPVIN